jgi:ATPase, P-type (transporting), HAD superfamily, subfamily IC/heavy metal translocating P-type ATPase
MKTQFDKYQPFIMPLLSGGFTIVGIILSNNLAPISFMLAFIIGGHKQAIVGIKATYLEKKLNVELLMLFAAIGAAIINYWLEGAMLIFIFSLSGALEEYTLDKNERAIHSLIDLQPTFATKVLATGKYCEIAIEEVKIGDKLLVRAGENVPIDAIISAGTSSLNESTITGEYLPKDKTVGDHVFGGTINLSTPIIIEVSAQLDDTLIRKIVKMVETAQTNPSKLAQKIDKLEDHYVKIVLLAVLGMFLIPPLFLSWGWQESFYHALVLLVVASPCALVAAVTPAVLATISNGARNGVLVKGGVHLENLYRLQAVIFDKTGTLTMGQLSVTDIEIFPKERQTEILQAVIILEELSTHPLAKSIVQLEHTKGISLPHITPTNVEDLTGLGITGTLFNHNWKIGKRTLMDGKDVSGKVISLSEYCASTGKTIVYIQCDDEIVGFLALQDQLREGIGKTIQQLNNYGIETVMLTGDNTATATAIGNEVGIKQVIAECLPTDKVAHLKEIAKKYPNIAMVGDGINDAPALANATIGIAMGKGADIAIEAADIVLMQSDASKIIYAYELSKRLNRIVQQNIVFSLSIIIFLVILNFLQQINLPFGVIGHEGSTILVILNSLRLLKTGKKS